MLDLNACFKAVGFARVEKFLVEIFRDKLDQLQALNYVILVFVIQPTYPFPYFYDWSQSLSQDDLLAIALVVKIARRIK